MARGFGSLLVLINKAFLAKQCWRLWSQLESLMAKIMKAKYYSADSILEARVESRPSFAWRSIHSSCDLLMEGLSWRIGNGSIAEIWKDIWLPNVHHIRSPVSVLSSEATVEAFIDEDLHEWNV